MADRDSTGKFVKSHSLGKRFEKGHQTWNKGKSYKCKQYRLTEEGKKQKIKNLKAGMKGKKHNEITKKKIGLANSHKSPEDAKRYNKDGYRQFTYKGRNILEHQYIWLRDNNQGMIYIPDGWVVHHKNQNKIDNRIDNLACIPKDFHDYLHWAIRKRGD